MGFLKIDNNHNSDSTFVINLDRVNYYRFDNIASFPDGKSGCQTYAHFNDKVFLIGGAASVDDAMERLQKLLDAAEEDDYHDEVRDALDLTDIAIMQLHSGLSSDTMNTLLRLKDTLQTIQNPQGEAE